MDYKAEAQLIRNMLEELENEEQSVIINDDDDAMGDNDKPQMINTYNSTKIGVDMVDQLSANNNYARNCARWPMVIFLA
jgi:hypothetical protein